MRVDWGRWLEREKLGSTGIYVRARVPPDWGWESVDIGLLDRESLLEWLRSHGGNNPWAESIVCVLLGHQGPPGEE